MHSRRIFTSSEHSKFAWCDIRWQQTNGIQKWTHQKATRSCLTDGAILIKWQEIGLYLDHCWTRTIYVKKQTDRQYRAGALSEGQV